MTIYRQIMHFSAAYLHEDWDIDHASFFDVFHQYLDDSPPEDIEQCKIEIKNLLNLNRSESSIYEILEEYGWNIQFEEGFLHETLKTMIKQCNTR